MRFFKRKEKLRWWPILENLALWDSAYPYDTFNYFLNDEFNEGIQLEIKKNKIFSDEEFSILLDIYSTMRTYFDNHEDVWTIDMNDYEAQVIKNKIINFLSLSSMQKDMEIIRKNPYYRWIWNFY